MTQSQDEMPRRERADGHWLILDYPKNPTIRFDTRLLDRVLARDDDLILDFDDMVISIPIEGGLKAASELSELLAPYTRAAPITRVEV